MKFISPFLIAIVTFAGIAPVFAQRNASTVRSYDRYAEKVQRDRTATEFRSTSAVTEGTGVIVEWEMAAEKNNFGFYVYRIDPDGRTQVAEDLIQGSASKVGSRSLQGEAYSVFDPNGEAGSVYVVEAFHLDGSRVPSIQFAARIVDSLRSAVNSSSYEMATGARPNSRELIADLDPSKELRSEIDSAVNAPDLDTHRWVIAQPGVRIGVRQEGMYRISAAELAAGGFNTATDPTNWQLYVEGRQQAIKVGDGGSFVEFYGKGVDTLESDTQAYFLINADSPGKRIATRLARPSLSTVVSPRYNQTFTLRERTNYTSRILNGDAPNFWGRSVTGTGTTLNFSLTGIDPTGPGAVIALKFQGFSLRSHEVQVTVNGNLLGSITGNLQDAFSGSLEIPASMLIEGTNALHMASIAPGSPADISFFDSVSVSYGRRYVSQGNKLPFHTEQNKRAIVEGFSSSDVRVFDTTVDGEIIEVLNVPIVEAGGTFSAQLPAYRTRRYYSIENGAMLQPVSISVNNTEMLSDPANQAELVIIAYKDFMPEAQTWATYRQNQGHSVKLIDVREIFDEFNYGVISADSIRDFLEMTTTTWVSEPGYVLLIGDSTTDPRNYFNVGFNHHVPTRMIDTIFMETGSDEYLADFDGDGLAEMAVGRIPARTGAAVTTALNKVVNWEANFVNSLQRGVLFAHDRIDGYDFEAMNLRIRNQLPVDVPTTLVHRDEPNAQANLVAAMNSGKFSVNYSGHGTAGAWAASSFFANSTVPQLTNTNNESIFTLLTCLNGYFVLPTTNSLAENLLFHQNGGSVATWASTGETTPDIQELMATRFYNKLGEGQIQRLGDLIRDAKGVIPGGGDVRLSWALLGDPMLKVRQQNGPDLGSGDIKGSRR